ncbi:MAG: Minf_1886 family protein [Candidatus Eisenbacteria bacterium]
MSGETTFWDAVDALRERETLYAREAYAFVVGALNATVRALPEARLQDAERRHLSGRELLEGVVALAHREFGVLGPTVFREWGVTSGADVGRIVFQLVECRQLSARAEDTMDDFLGMPDLLERLAAVADFGVRRDARPGTGADPGDAT